MKGRVWLLLGVAAGIAVAAGHLPYLAGAGRLLTTTAEHLVQSGQNRLVSGVASTGASRRVVLGIGAVLAVLLPGVTALLLIVAAKAVYWLRVLVGVLVAALGAVTFVYESQGKATGALVLALVVAGVALFLTGPLLITPLAFTAALIGAEFLPTLFEHRVSATAESVNALHSAIYGKPGTPLVLQVILLVVAVLPFAWAALLAWRR